MTSVCKLHTNHSDYHFFLLVETFNAPFIWLSHLAPVHSVDSVRSCWNWRCFLHRTPEASEINEIEWIPVGMTTMSTTMIETIKFDTKNKNRKQCANRWWDRSLSILRIFHSHFDRSTPKKNSSNKNREPKWNDKKKLYETASNRGRPYVFSVCVLFFLAFFYPIRIFFALKRVKKR